MNQIDEKKSVKRKKIPSSLWLNKPKRRRSCETLLISGDKSTPALEKKNTVVPGISTLNAAPKKIRKCVKPQKSRKKLFEELSCTGEVLSLMPTVLKNVQKAGHLADFINLLKLISVDKFPLNNISFLLLLEVARWYSLENTTKMFYSDQCMRFWKVLYRLFHGKALRFMQGVKSSGQILNKSTSRGQFDPQDTNINFAVPDIKTVNNYESCTIDIPKQIQPGLIEQAIQMKPKTDTYVLSVDGKKLAPGLTKDNGDIDLFGYGMEDSIQKLRLRLKTEKDVVTSTRDDWSTMSPAEKCQKLQDIVLIISYRIKDLRLLFMKQKLALSKFHKEAGDDWRSSRFVYAISSTQAQIYQVRQMVKELLDVNNSLICVGASVRNQADVFVSDMQTDCFSQDNWITLKDQSSIPEDLKTTPRFIKQRSEEWFQLREKFKVTGSSLYKALGLDLLKNQQSHFDKVISGKKSTEEFSEEVKKRMEHGTINEINATATLVSKFLPFYYPEMKYIEEGVHLVNDNDQPYIIVSPDGSLGYMDTLSSSDPVPLIGCEFKCPVATKYKTPVHYEIPKRYVTQVLSEMAAMDVKELMYLCWTEESSTVFRAKFDADLWKLVTDEIKDVYLCQTPKRPTRLSERSKLISEKIEVYRKTMVTFLCEIPSVKATSREISQTHVNSPYVFPVVTKGSVDQSTENIELTLCNVNRVIDETYEICRRKATEVLVWLLSDTNRCWNIEIPHSLPVAYAMKGYSLTTQTMRTMNEHILEECNARGIDIVCTCFDGQWIKLATRDVDERPLTLLQLQRDVYETASKEKRNTILKHLSEKPIADDLENDVCAIRNESGGLNVTSELLRKVFQAIHYTTKSQNVTKRDLESKQDKVQSDGSLSCLPDEALEVLIESENLISCEDDVAPLDDNETTDTNEPDTTQNASANVLEDSTVRTSLMSDDTVTEILCKFKEHQKSNVKKKWQTKSAQDLRNCFSDISKLLSLTHIELNIIIELTEQYQRKAAFPIRKSWKILDKANAVSKLIGSGIQKERTVKRMVSLKESALKVVQNNTRYVPKSKLNNVYAVTLYKDSYRSWISKSPFNETTEVEGVGHVKWFSYPEVSEKRNKMEPKCLDAHHLLVNLRVKVCKDGLQGIQKRAWHAVAEKNRDIISKSLVVDLIDKQNNAFALRTFSTDVESEMRKLGFIREADFCKLIREWYEAEDESGISAVDRMKRRINLKSFLLEGVDFGRYPMYGMYVKGFPKVQFEGFLQRIDTSLQLYSVVKNGSFNQRAISSLANETFFGELSEMEPTKLGCPKAVNIPRLMSTVTELHHFRSNPNDRSFKIVTTRKSVYPSPDLVEHVEDDAVSHQCDQIEEMDTSPIKISSINLREHAFDRAKRKRKKRVTKRSDVSMPNQVARGCMPIRFHHKCDESKVLPTTRLGIDMKDPSAV